MHGGGEGVRVVVPGEVPGPRKHRQLPIVQMVGQFANGCMSVTFLSPTTSSTGTVSAASRFGSVGSSSKPA